MQEHCSTNYRQATASKKKKIYPKHTKIPFFASLSHAKRKVFSSYFTKSQSYTKLEKVWFFEQSKCENQQNKKEQTVPK